jgi:hypothetical protein
MSNKSTYLNSPSCIFFNNRAYEFGGGVNFRDSSVYSNSQNCTFSNNMVSNADGVGGPGGAINYETGAIYKDSPNCTFENNMAGWGGAISFAK